MAKTFNLAARNYAAGTYGPFSVDGFTQSDTDWLELSLTVENWPAGSPVVTGQMRWDSGDGADFAFHHPTTNRDGTPRTKHTVRVSVPQTSHGKADVVSGTVTLTLVQPLRTAVSVIAGQTPSGIVP